MVLEFILSRTLGLANIGVDCQIPKLLNVLTSDVSNLRDWTRFSWNIFRWLTNPTRVILICAAVAIAPHLLPQWLSPRQWRRHLSKAGIILLVIYLVGVSPPGAALATQGLIQFLPQDSGTSADAIVVLSRSEAEVTRYEIATRLFQSGRAPKIFVMGSGHVDTVRRLLMEDNLPTQAVSGSRCNLTTQDEALSTAAILGPQGVRQILLITDPPHLLRSHLTFQGLGFSVIPYPSPLAEEQTSVEQFLLAVREYLGLISYAALGRFQQQSPDELQQPSLELLRPLNQRDCEIGAIALL